MRKPASRVFTLDEYVRTGTMTERQKEALCLAVGEHQNTLVIGGTGSGKTTLANALIAEMVRRFPMNAMSSLKIPVKSNARLKTSSPCTPPLK